MEAREAEELLQIEEADAWFEYLEATRGQSEVALRRDRAVGLEPPDPAAARHPGAPRAAAAGRRLSGAPPGREAGAEPEGLLAYGQAMPTFFTVPCSARPAAEAAASLRAPTQGDPFVSVVSLEAQEGRGAGAAVERTCTSSTP